MSSVTFCMGAAKPIKVDYDAAAKIQGVIFIEKNIGLPDMETLQ